MALFQVEQNPPCPVFFAGWESDTWRLGRQGWRIAMDDRGDITTSLILFHPKSRIKAFASARRDRPLSYYMSPFQEQHLNNMREVPRFYVDRISTDAFIRHEPSHIPLLGFDWIETEPQRIVIKETDIHNTPLFRKLAAPVAEQLIIDPNDVSAMLEQIRLAQSPEQAAIRARNRSREAPNDIPMVHATILSFPKAA